MSIVINPTVPHGRRAGRGGDRGAAAGDGGQRPGAANPRQRHRCRLRSAASRSTCSRRCRCRPARRCSLRFRRRSDGTIRLAVVGPQGGAAAHQGPAGAATAASDSVTLAPGASAGIAAPTTSAVVVSNNQLTPLEALAVSVAAQTAATQQTSLAPLFANLGVAAGLDRPAAAGATGGGASAGAADQPRSWPERRRHQAGVPEFRPVSGSRAGVRIGFRVGRHAGSQGGADRAAAGAD